MYSDNKLINLTVHRSILLMSNNFRLQRIIIERLIVMLLLSLSVSNISDADAVYSRR